MHKPTFLRNLLDWYSEEARDLPWRRTRDPYCLWLSEIILQQTRVDQGLPYYERFVRRFPNVQELAAASLDEVLKLWEGLGYYTRARNLHRCAQVVVERHDGVFPDNAAGLLTLPGIGRYTAGAIASMAFDEPAPILDGNVIRVLSRIYDLEDCVDDAGTRKHLWDLASGLVSAKSPGAFNQALMELGACVCTPREPICGTCPVRRQCRARRRGMQADRPVRRKKKPVPHHEVVVGAIRRDGHYLLGKRPPEGLLGGLWEFPGGKVEQGETHAEALKRELREELGIGVSVGGLIATVKHAYTHFKITLSVYRCDVQTGEPRAVSHDALEWVAPEDFGKYAFPKANQKFLGLLT